jgi:SpoIIAA-like
MMELIDGLPDNVVGIRATGEVEDDDYEDVLVPAIDAARSKHDKIRLLYVLGPEFTGYEMDAMWEDTKLGARTFTAYDKLAVVTDKSWVQRTVKAFGWMIPGEVKVFHTDALDDATSWITS